MIIFRPIRQADFDQFCSLASQAHLGFYTLPKDKRLLEQRLITSLESFAVNVELPKREIYTFVAEEMNSHKLVGVSAIIATAEGKEPLYFFRRERLAVHSHHPAVVPHVEILSGVSYVRGPSEVCSLFVLPEYRKVGCGKLLSLARFLFISCFPRRFTGSLFAELRGPIGEDDSSPFWEGLGRHFFNMPLNQIHEMLHYGRSFISDFLPKYPIYVSLLPEQVQRAIGAVDTHTQGALSLLSRQGFSATDEIDIFDGGPKLRAQKEEIHAIKKSVRLTVTDIQKTAYTAENEVLISNTRLDFRACVAKFKKLDDQKACIDHDVARGLEVGLGDQICVYAG